MTLNPRVVMLDLMKHNKTILAYLAGVLDGDGSFCIHLKRQRICKPTRPDKITSFTAKIQIKQVQPEAIELIHETFGGIIPRMVKPSAKNGKPLWFWEISGSRAAEVSNLLIPYLRLKKRQAEILIELCCLIDETGVGEGREEGRCFLEGVGEGEGEGERMGVGLCVFARKEMLP